MTRKSKARFGMSRTYKLTPAAKALRAALFAGVAVAATAPTAQAACVVAGNTVTCTGIFNGTVNNGDEWTVVTPADMASIVFDLNTNIQVINAQFGADSFNTGAISTINNGNISVYNEVGAAVAMRTSSGTGNATAGNNGSISAISTVSYARGIVVSSTNGDVTASNTGSIISSGATSSLGVFAYSTNGDITAYNSGDVTAYSGTGIANGFRLAGGTGTVTFNSNGGNITAKSTSSQAIGIVATTGNGDVIVNNSSDILAQSGPASATYGIFARAGGFGDATVINDGYIHAIAANGLSTGVLAASNNYDVYLGGTGHVFAESTGGTVRAVRALSFNGDSTVNVFGDMTATSVSGNAFGVQSYARYVSDVFSGGDVVATSTNGAAFGVYGQAARLSSIVTNAGNVQASSVTGNASGVMARSNLADANVFNYGDVTVASANGLAYGVYALADNDNAFLLNYGVVDASSITNDASALVSIGSEQSVVFNYGNISAGSEYGDALGIVSVTNSGLNQVVSRDGTITANSYAGNAYGIYATNELGNTNVFNYSNMAITSEYGSAYGISAATGYGDVFVRNHGALTVSGEDSSIGILSYGANGESRAYNYGALTVIANNGEAIGIGAINSDFAYVRNNGVINASSFGYSESSSNDANGIVAYAEISARVANNAAVNVYSEYGDAAGLTAFAGNFALVFNTGQITATSQYGVAEGINAISSAGNAEVLNLGALTINGNYGASGIHVQSFSNDISFVYNRGVMNVSTNYGNATGIYAGGKYYVTVNNIANMTISGGSAAFGISTNSENGVTSINNSGDFVVGASYTAIGINAYSEYGDIFIYNTGDLRATGYDARGISVNTNEYDSDITINNSLNTIVASASANGEAYGIYAYSDGSGDINITSSGIITATGGDAFGIYAATDNDDSYYGESGVYFAGGNIGITLGTASNITATATYLGSYGEYGAYAGGNAYGVFARVEEPYGDISISNAGRITAITPGIYSEATGIHAHDQDDGQVTISLASTSVISASSTGIYGTAFGVNAIADDGNVAISNAGSIAANSTGFSVGIRTVSETGTSISNSGTIGATGNNPWAIVSYSEGNTVITNSSTGVINGAIWTATGYGNDSLSNTGRWNVGNDNSSQFGFGNDTITNNVGGRIFMDDSAIFMGSGTNAFLNNGKLYANNDNLIHMGYSEAASVFTNNGSSIHMNDGDVNDSLTIVGNFAGTGRIYVDANGTSMLADRLYIQGDVVTNTANVIDVFLSGQPSLEDVLNGEQIDIVSVTGVSTAANFNLGVVTLNDNELFAMSAQLNKQINFSGTNDLFSLGFTIDGLSSTGVAASSITPGVQSLWNQGVGTLFQREGSRREYRETGNGGYVADYKGGAGAWLRGFSGSGGISPDASNNNFGASDNHNFDFSGTGVEFGLGYAFNNSWTVGVLGGTSDSTLKPTQGGRVKIDGSTFGGYLTYTPGNGFYADLSYRSLDFDGNGNGGGNDFGFDGKADGFSLELGYGYKTASGLVIEPQFQYSMVDVDLENISYTNYDFVSTDGDSTQMRLGVALRKSFKTAKGNDWTPYGALSYIEESDGANSYQIGGLLAGDVSTDGGSTLLEVGATGRFGGVGISGGLNWRDGGAFDSVVGGQVSLRYDW